MPDFKSASFDDASRSASDEATRKAESQVLDAIEENLPEDSEEQKLRMELGSARIGRTLAGEPTTAIATSKRSAAISSTSN